MKFTDIHICNAEYFSLGVEEVSGKYYVSIPVSNPYVDYEEYYEVDKTIVEKYPSNIGEVRALVESCVRHENDNNLIMQPGRLRGTPYVLRKK